MAQIVEDYCSFELSKLLKEKGFDEKCTHYYKNEKYLVDLGYTNIHSYANSDLIEEFAAPTLQMAMKWFLKKYNIFICVLFLEESNGFGYTIEDIIKKKYIDTSKNLSYKVPEEACEAAIKYCLENLI